MHALRLVLGLFLLIAAGGIRPAGAEIKMTGSFVATEACDAWQSFKRKVNPGKVRIVVGQSYELLAKNRDRASFYLIVVPGAEPANRWVGAKCGTIPGQPATETKTAPGDFFVLALSWQPAFCEGKPNKTECRAMDAASPFGRQLSLHGLWPQPARNVYCGVDPAVAELDKTFHWYDLPAPLLSADTRAALDAVMPGTQSVLERHEWIKHGTCYPGATAETYFKDSVRLTQAINASAVGTFLAGQVGKTVTAEALRRKFEEAFGAGAGLRVRLACERDGNRQLLGEITIGLKGNIAAGAPLPELIAASKPTDPGCPEGLIDPVGLQ
jgi:ribonuclease T2